jgi:hypothetical protein
VSGVRSRLAGLSRTEGSRRVRSAFATVVGVSGVRSRLAGLSRTEGSRRVRSAFATAKLRRGLVTERKTKSRALQASSSSASCRSDTSSLRPDRLVAARSKPAAAARHAGDEVKLVGLSRTEASRAARSKPAAAARHAGAPTALRYSSIRH